MVKNNLNMKHNLRLIRTRQNKAYFKVLKNKIFNAEHNLKHLFTQNKQFFFSLKPTESEFYMCPLLLSSKKNIILIIIFFLI